MNAALSMAQPEKPTAYLEAEQAVLGALMFNDEVYWRLADFLEARHFYEPLHQRIFATISELVGAGRRASIITVASALESDKALAELNGLAYLKVMVAASISAPDALDYARLICSLAQRRELILAGHDIITMAQRGHESGEDARLLEDAEARVLAVKADAQATSGGLESLGTAADRAVAQGIVAHENPEKAGISTGIAAIDSLIGRLYPGDLIFVGGATSMGKTSLLQAFGLNAARAGRNVACFSLEMTKEQWSARYLSQLARISTETLESGRFDAEQLRRFQLAAQYLRRLPMMIDDSGELRVSQMRARAGRLSRTSGLDLLLVDHLHFIAGEDPRADEKTRLGQITRDLKAMGKALRVPVACAAHLNRDHQKRPDHRPMNSDLYGSSAIEKDADIIMFVHREHYYLERAGEPKDPDEVGAWLRRLEETKGTAEIISTKRRRGKVGSRYINFSDEFTLFYDDEHDPRQEVLV